MVQWIPTAKAFMENVVMQKNVLKCFIFEKKKNHKQHTDIPDAKPSHCPQVVYQLML